jgi:aminopeptidase-like protein
MDTTTVLEIIKMIDAQIDYKSKNLPINNDMNYHIAIGQEIALSELSAHLYEYIEAELNAAENQTGE